MILPVILAILFYDNYKSFLKIFFADGVVYQSDYSKKLHEKYFDKKKIVRNS